MRGYRLESLGILVAKSTRPRPWRHLTALKELSRKLEDHWTSLNSQYSETEGEQKKTSSCQFVDIVVKTELKLAETSARYQYEAKQAPESKLTEHNIFEERRWWF